MNDRHSEFSPFAVKAKLMQWWAKDTRDTSRALTFRVDHTTGCFRFFKYLPGGARLTSEVAVEAIEAAFSGGSLENLFSNLRWVGTVPPTKKRPFRLRRRCRMIR